MGSTLAMIGSVVLPAIIAFAIYLLLTFLVVPVWQHYRNRYSHYLPIDSLSHQTTSLRQRVTGFLGRYFLPSAWRHGSSSSASYNAPLRNFRSNLALGLGGSSLFQRFDNGDDLGFSSDDDDDDLDGIVLGEEGEELGVIRPVRGLQHERALTAQHTGAYNTSRLSRDLEEGFMDDSDEEEVPAR